MCLMAGWVSGMKRNAAVELFDARERAGLFRRERPALDARWVLLGRVGECHEAEPKRSSVLPSSSAGRALRAKGWFGCSMSLVGGPSDFEGGVGEVALFDA